MKAKRFSYYGYSGEGGYSSMDKEKDGDYVLYADYEHLVDVLKDLAHYNNKEVLGGFGMAINEIIVKTLKDIGELE